MLAEPDPEGGSVLVDMCQEEQACVREGELRGVLLGDSLTGWSSVLTVPVTVTYKSEPIREDAGGGVRTSVQSTPFPGEKQQRRRYWRARSWLPRVFL